MKTMKKLNDMKCRRTYGKRFIGGVLMLVLVAAVAFEMPWSKTEAQAKDYEIEYTTPLTFSYEEQSKADKVLDLYEEALEAEEDEFVYLEAEMSDKDSGQVYKYKQTTSSSSYLYYGDMKKGRPNGKGVVFKNGVVIYIGNFKTGSPSGYGIEFTGSGDYDLQYEGEWKNGKYNGDGYEYSLLLVSEEEDDDSEEDEDGSIVTDIQLTPNFLKYEGQFKSGEYNGKGTSYMMDFDTLEIYVYYDGNYKNGKHNGEGTEYFYYSDTIQYTGKFKNDEYNGKGKLYDENGELIYSGTFKNGDIK